MRGARPEPTPLRDEVDTLKPFDGAEGAETYFDCAMFLCGLARYSRTNPGPSFVVHERARFMQRRGPDHVDAAHRVFRQILLYSDAGLTYHGSGAVLGQSYDHLNRPIGAFDADFPHAGAKATSGVMFFINGAAIA